MTRHPSRDRLAAIAIVAVFAGVLKSVLLAGQARAVLLAALAIVVVVFAGACWAEPAAPPDEPVTPASAAAAERAATSPSGNPRLPLAADAEPFLSTVPPLTYDVTVEPRNVSQLRRSIDRAYSAYEGQLRDLMRERGEELHGIAAAHELIGQQADDAYTAFQVEQKRLQDAFNAHMDAR